MTGSLVGLSGMRAARWTLVAALFLPACSSKAPEPRQPDVVVAPARPATLPTPQSTARAAAAVPRRPAPVASPMAVHKAFTDPPLPPELLDDGGLTPLPPRPPPAPAAH